MVGPVVVEEAPCADEAALALRQGAADVHGTRPAQRDGAGRKHLDVGSGALRGLAKHFPGDGFGVAHVDKPRPGRTAEGANVPVERWRLRMSGG
jgi:hypothetical protein